MKKNLSSLILFAVFGLIVCPPAFAQLESNLNNDVRPFDHVINKRGESRLSLLTGIPFVGSSEFAYGISDRLTVGILGGFTPIDEAVGIRVRTVLYQHPESFRVYFCTPVIFYPQTGKLEPDPWFLTRPNINFEWLRESSLRYKVGGSIIATASHHDLFGDPLKSMHPPGLWTAVHGGISLPVGPNISFQAELSYVMKGVRTIKKFFGGPPFILITGISYSFCS